MSLSDDRVPGKPIGRIIRQYLASLLSGENQDKDLLEVASLFGYEVVSRAATDTVVGVTGGSGDYCLYIIVVTPPSTNDIVVSDGGSDMGIAIPTTASVNDVIYVGHMCGTNFTVDADTTSPQDTTGKLKFVGLFT